MKFLFPAYFLFVRFVLEYHGMILNLWGEIMRFSSFDELLRHFASATPDAPAFCFAAGNEKKTRSYADFYAAVCERADVLRESGKTVEEVFKEVFSYAW